MSQKDGREGGPVAENRHTVEYEKNLSQLLSHLADHPNATDKQLVAVLVKGDRTIDRYLKDAKDRGWLAEGRHVTRKWRRVQAKAYIFIETKFDRSVTRQKPKLNYQEEVTWDITQEIKRRPQLYMESMEIVLGAKFNIILVLYAATVGPIGDFVKGCLPERNFIINTQTVMVWPGQEE
jgi:hypothetical protein